MRKQGMTLIELMVVIIIISIFAGLFLPQYGRNREKTIDKEAPVILNMIHAGENTYWMQREKYYPDIGSTVNEVDLINGNLSLDIKSSNWVYRIEGAQGFLATLTRTAGWGYDRYWYINSTMVNASCSGCP